MSTDDAVDWDTRFDHFDPRYAADPVAVWTDLRERGVIARGERFRGMWVPVSHADVSTVAEHPELFSSRSPVIADFGAMADFGVSAPPISSDPPYHTGVRRMLLPFFGPKRIEALRPGIEAHADALIDGFADGDGCDAAVDYARHIPVRVIATMLGVPLADEDRFFGWVHQLLELAPTDLAAAGIGLFDFFAYFHEQLDERRDERRDDLMSFLLDADIDGRPLDNEEIMGICLLLLLAGIDTTWSSIGASIWHFAQHPEQRARLRAEPELWPTTVEELLRCYAPVTMAREVKVDTEVLGCPMHAGDPLLLPFPAANRDPAAFPDPDEVVLDRAENRHLAFGLGIHRCLGSNLARLEVGVAVRRFLERVPDFELAGEVSWSRGQVRGPRTLPLRFA